MKTASRIRRWFGTVLTPDGSVPLLNDGCQVRAAAGGWDLVADIRALCPDQLLAHAHAETLGCVLHVDGTPLLVDSGTWTGAPGPAHRYERSATAHRRRWLLNGARLQVHDELTGGGRHSVALRWHLAPGTHVRLLAGGAVVSTAAGHFLVRISASVPLRISIDSAMVATGSRTSILTPVLTCRVDSALPIRITTCWRRALGDAWRAP
jgi:Heparinase II/III-like protein